MDENRDVKQTLISEGFDAGVIARYEQWHISGNPALYAAESDTFDQISAALADEGKPQHV